MLVLNATALCSVRLIPKISGTYIFMKNLNKKNLGPQWRVFFALKVPKVAWTLQFSTFRFHNSLVARAACNCSKVFRNHHFFWRCSLPNLCDSPRQLAILVVSPQHPPDRRAFRLIQHTNRQKSTRIWNVCTIWRGCMLFLFIFPLFHFLAFRP